MAMNPGKNVGSVFRLTYDKLAIVIYYKPLPPLGAIYCNVFRKFAFVR